MLFLLIFRLHIQFSLVSGASSPENSRFPLRSSLHVSQIATDWNGKTTLPRVFLPSQETSKPGNAPTCRKLPPRQISLHERVTGSHQSIIIRPKRRLLAHLLCTECQGVHSSPLFCLTPPRGTFPERKGRQRERGKTALSFLPSLSLYSSPSALRE